MDTILIANRGEIARRVIRTARRMGLRTVSVFSDADAGLPHVREADTSVRLGPAPPRDSYLSVEKLIDSARQSGADAVHPGYGFLSENAGFAAAVRDAGLVWIGPSPEVIATMGNKLTARTLMAGAGVPVARGSSSPTTAEAALRDAAEIGYPVMVKASHGGGGIGISVAHDERSLLDALSSGRELGERFFGNGELLVEECIQEARHVEVQILGLNDGRVLALGDRDCSTQRRNQKICEETPAPGLSDDLRARMHASAIRCGEIVGYRGTGTVEFLLHRTSERFVFLEMNTRLQVEHTITEMVTGLDLVEEQIRIAGGSTPSFPVGGTSVSGHAFEFRINAEDPTSFFPSPGRITSWSEPEGPGIRVDSGYGPGDTITPFYDPLVAKLCVHGSTRREALERAVRATSAFTIEGPMTNLPLFQDLLRSELFISGDYDTKVLERIERSA